MALIILPICFISIFLSLAILQGISRGKKELLLYTVLIFSTLVVAITELLSLFHCLNYTSILISWIVIILVNTLYHYIKRHKLYAFYKEEGRQIKQKCSGLNSFQWLLIIVVSAMLLLIFVQGIVYPPTNWDSMTYHLARIPSWISQQSVAHFPTAITRQLYQPPFAEFVMLHANILNGGDYFSASVQFFFLLFSLVVVACIVQSFGLNRKYQLTAVVLAATIPEVVLQASSTQNDVVVALFILAGFYFALKAIRELKFKYYLFFGLALGLALLTKGTAYVYMVPVLLVFGVAILTRLFKTGKLAWLAYAFMVIIIAITINIGHYTRNYNLTGNILGVDTTEARLYSTQKTSPGLLASNIIKNAGLHMQLMFAPGVGVMADSAIYKLHRAMGIDVNDAAVNYRGMQYKPGTIVTNEDEAPNPFHFILILCTIIIPLFNWKRWREKPEAYALLLIILLQIILFCGYLKWQPWNSRLHVPVFLLAIPLICYAGSLLPFKRTAYYIILPLLIIYAVLTVLHNDSRPISAKMWQQGRYQKYFTNKPAAYAEYAAVTHIISQNNYKNIGLMIGIDDWEYPLFTNCYTTQLNPVHINVNNISNHIKPITSRVDCIVSITINKPFIDYKQKRFYNRDSKNKVIYLYK